MISSLQGVSGMNTDMMLMMRERMFARADQNGDGGIDQAELQQMADTMSERTGLSINVEESFASMDADGNGLIDNTEFAQPPPLAKEMGNREAPPSMFSRADLNGDGVIDETELQQMADKMSERTGMTIDAEASFASLDTNGDGRIDESEFPEGPPMPPPAAMATFDTQTIMNEAVQSLLSGYSSMTKESTDLFSVMA